MKVALTGHRPERLRGHEAEVREWIEQQFKTNNFSKAYCGMAQGADQIFGSVAKENDIPIVCCLPFPKKKYHPFEEYLMDGAWIYTAGQEYNKQNYFIRDKYMVDQSDVLLAVWDGIEFGGTYNTIKYAKEQGKKIIYIPQSILLKNK